MSRTAPTVLYEDNHLLAVSKPAMLATMGVTPGKASLISRCKEYLKRKYDKPGNVYLGVVSRLDSLVTGVVVFARTSKAAARLNDQFRARRVKKRYWALVLGDVKPESGELVDWLIKSERVRRMLVMPRREPGAKQAVLYYETLAHDHETTMLEINPRTGRKHQIRVQLAHQNHVILGDRKYGSSNYFPQGIALHARSLELEHPVRKTPLALTADVPGYWNSMDVYRQWCAHN